jgi:hypothetical protein
VEDLQREISQREIDPREKARSFRAVSRSQYNRIRCLFVYAAVKAALVLEIPRRPPSRYAGQ